MKKRIVIWGTCANEERCLVALELRDKENKVDLYTFPENVATETFYNQMMNIWREGRDLPFAEGYTKIERDLAITEDLLPEDIKVDRPDVIVRAKAEWHFVVLSSKLYEIYNSELEDLKEKIEQLKEYDDTVWEEMKAFWAKVQEQSIEKNIFRGHANTLKEKTNKLFDKLKDLKKILDQRFREESREKAAEFKKKLEAVEEKIEQGLGLKPIFEELKKMQGEFHGIPLTRKDRRKTWEYLDGLFKKVKAKRFGDKKGGQKSGEDRVSGRYDGLISAIGKMEKSIQRDRQEQDFQNKRISQTDGQLEMQIRQAKILMIDGVNSKEEKLEDMYKTKVDLEAKMAKIKQREEQKKTQEKVKEVKEEIKEKIADSISEQVPDLDKKAENLKKAAEEINESKKKPQKKETLISAISETMGESLEDVVDTVKAVANVVGEKIEEAAENLKEKVSNNDEEDDKKEPPVGTTTLKEESQETSKEEEKKESILDSITDAVGETMEDVVDKVKAVADVVTDKIEEVTEDIKEKMSDPAEEDDKKEPPVDTTTLKEESQEAPKEEEKKESILDSITDAVSETFDDVTDTISAVAGAVSEKIDEVLEEIKKDEEE